MGWSAMAMATGCSLLLCAGCVATADDGYGYGYAPNVNVGIGLDYYDQYGGDYGGWGPDYGVGPWRGGGPRPRRGEPHPGGDGHGFRSAPASRGTPSIPSGARAGGHGGGGHGGGGHGGH
jgi:hypothetical protein